MNWKYIKPNAITHVWISHTAKISIGRKSHDYCCSVRGSFFYIAGQEDDEDLSSLPNIFYEWIKENKIDCIFGTFQYGCYYVAFSTPEHETLFELRFSSASIEDLIAEFEELIMK